MYAFRNSGFTKEQLTSLGAIGRDQPVVAQTPLFPPLISRPIEIDINSKAMNFKVIMKEQFKALAEIHSNSELNLTDNNYSAKVSNAYEKLQREKKQFKFAWSQMPSELRPQSHKRKLTGKPNKAKRARVIPTEVVNEKLQLLEQKERENPEGDDKSVKADNESDEEVDDDEEGKIEDQEMDDDLDYGNNYFDNGEGFNEEDDNLDDGDGPVY